MVFRFCGGGGLGLLAVLSLAPVAVRADLPIACYHSEIIGTWDFTMGVFNGPNCGWSTPDAPGGHKHITPDGAKGVKDPVDPDKYFMSDKFQPFGVMNVVLTDWHAQPQELRGMDGKPLSEELMKK